MRTPIATMGLVLTIMMCTASAQSQTVVQPRKPSPGPDKARVKVEIERMDVFVCPRHPEAKATWPARCPMCQAQMRRRPTSEIPQRMGMESRMKSGMSAMSPAITMRHQMMMHTPIHVYDPEALLGSQEALGLTQDQVQELRMIVMKARRAAMATLTEPQRRRLMPLERMTGFPLTMAQVHQKMMQRMSSGQGMMGGLGMGAMMPKDDPPAPEQGRSGEYRGDDPGPTSERLMDPAEDFGERERTNGEERFGDERGFDGEEGFGSDEDFGFDQGFGDNEEFGNNGELGPEEGFGDREGFRNNEDFDNEERFGGDERFGAEEGFRGGEGSGGEERLGTRSRGR